MAGFLGRATIPGRSAETYCPIVHLPYYRACELIDPRPKTAKESVPSSSDDQRILRLKAGDEQAFGELYEQYRPRVYRFALKLLSDRDQAEDIAQDTFLKARQSIHTLAQTGSLLSWLFSIARNEVYTHIRKTRSNGQVEVDDVWDSGTPLDELVGAETVVVVQNMIAQLRPAYKEVILLREYERMSYAEIAHITNDSEGAVKARLFKARKALVKKLKPYFEEKE